MMDLLKTLALSFVLQIVVTVLLVLAGGLFVRKRTGWNFLHPSVLTVVGLTIGLLQVSSTLFHSDQSRRMGEHLQAQAQAQNQTQERVITQEDIQKLRISLLATLEQMASSEQAPPPGVKEELVRRFAPALPRGMLDLQILGTETKRALDCQLQFFNDALRAMNEKKIVKSDARKKCENSSGVLFGREKLVPAEIAANNDKIIEGISKGREVKNASGQPIEISREGLTKAVEKQKTKLSNLDKILN